VFNLFLLKGSSKRGSLLCYPVKKFITALSLIIIIMIIIILIIIITDLYSACGSKDTEALDAAQED